MKLIACLALVCGVACGGSSNSLGGDDADGVQGGDYTFVVTVDDAAFQPNILKAQNVANVTLTLQNKGTKPHDLVVAKIPSASVPSVAPGASATITFVTPTAEGIYDFTSDVAGDTQAGQLIIQ